MRRTILVAVLVLVTVLLVGCGTAVPDVKGMTADQAQAALKGARFTLGAVTYDENATGASGAVVFQDPAADKRAKGGTAVALTVAGFPPVATPNLSGLDKVKAEAALVATGLIMGTVTESYDDSVTAGIVSSQTPAPSVEAPRGSPVALVISKGPAPVAVPQVKGKTQAEATTLLEAAGFNVKVEQKADSAKKGIVIAQKPESGTAQPGSTVTITVSTGVEMVKVPNIYGMMDPDPVLLKVGLKPKGISIHGPIESDCADIGEAYRQNPKAGALVPKGTTVSYHFWWEAG